MGLRISRPAGHPESSERGVFDPGKREAFRFRGGPVADLHDSQTLMTATALEYYYFSLYTIGSVSRGNKIRGAGGATPGGKESIFVLFLSRFWRE